MAVLDSADISVFMLSSRFWAGDWRLARFSVADSACSSEVCGGGGEVSAMSRLSLEYDCGKSDYYSIED